jgi:hypothetical protein
VRLRIALNRGDLALGQPDLPATLVESDVAASVPRLEHSQSLTKAQGQTVGRRSGRSATSDLRRATKAP